MTADRDAAAALYAPLRAEFGATLAQLRCELKDRMDAILGDASLKGATTTSVPVGDGMVPTVADDVGTPADDDDAADAARAINTAAFQVVEGPRALAPLPCPIGAPPSDALTTLRRGSWQRTCVRECA